MLFILSPAKSLDYQTPWQPQLGGLEASEPRFMARSHELMKTLKKLKSPDIAALMDLSDKLSELNAARFKAWQPDTSRAAAADLKPALLAFDGDVYDGLNAKTLSSADLAWAQARVRMLSGLYGALRPLDLMQPYRLEMGTALAGTWGKNLYAFWGAELAQSLNDDLAHLAALPAAAKTPSKKPQPPATVINLASQEYFGAVDRKALHARVVDCVFEDYKGGTYKIISFFAKKARGLMLRYALDTRAERPQDLLAFDREGYAFDPEASSADRWVFRRRVAE